MKVAIDTSVFRGDPFLRGGHFEALARAAEAGHVEILVPEVVAEEFSSITGPQAKAMDGLRTALSTLRKVAPDELAARIDVFGNEVREFFKTVETSAGGRFNSWLSRVNGSVIKAGDGHAGRVLAKYFDGVLPFGSRKSKSDFPDAFIAEIFIDLAAVNELLVVTRDKRMKGALKGIPGITVFDSLIKLLESDRFSELRIDLPSSLSRIVQSIDLNKSLFADALLEGIANLAAHAEYQEDEENEDLYIDVIESIDEFTLRTDDAEYIGEGVISIAFEATAEVSIDQPTLWGMDWAPWSSRPTIGATLEVQGACSFIIDPLDLHTTFLESEGWLERARLEVDELHHLSVISTERDGGEY